MLDAMQSAFHILPHLVLITLIRQVLITSISQMKKVRNKEVRPLDQGPRAS